MKKTIQRTIQILFSRTLPLSAHQGQGTGVDGNLPSFACSLPLLLPVLLWMDLSHKHPPETDYLPEKKKFRVGSIKTPAFLKNGVLRILLLIAFLGLMVFTLRTGKQLPVLPALVAIAVFLSLFFEEELWHHWLCPYGTILSFPSRAAKRRMVIDAELCTNCGRCKRVCPSGAIVKEEKHRIIKSECLVCHECERVCTKGAISYK